VASQKDLETRQSQAVEPSGRKQNIRSLSLALTRMSRVLRNDGRAEAGLTSRAVFSPAATDRRTASHHRVLFEPGSYRHLFRNEPYIPGPD